MDPHIRSRAPQEMNDQILRCLSVASFVVFHSFMRREGNPLGLVWDWPFWVRFLATQKMNASAAADKPLTINTNQGGQPSSPFIALKFKPY
jgi:hypothetical protein